MRTSFLVLVAVALVTVFFAAPGIAGVTDWGPGDTYKMHWPQLPDTTTLGLDVNCITNSTQCSDCMLADDWECSETGFVKEVHFWGSWMSDSVGTIDAFDIRIYENDNSGPFSKPGAQLWQYTVSYVNPNVHARQLQTYTKNEGWYSPCGLLFRPANHRFYYQYNVTIPHEIWYTQVQGTIYWLSVRPIMHSGSQACWGWKTARRQDHFMDDAVYSCSGGPWLELKHPLDQFSLDLAFVITGGPQQYLLPGTPSLSTWGVLILVLALIAVSIALLRKRIRVGA